MAEERRDETMETYVLSVYYPSQPNEWPLPPPMALRVESHVEGLVPRIVQLSVYLSDVIRTDRVCASADIAVSRALEGRCCVCKGFFEPLGE